MSCSFLLLAQGKAVDSITLQHPGGNSLSHARRGSWMSHRMPQIVTQSCQLGSVLSQQGSSALG